ncbi:MAG: dTDP-4-dehydrorhamnose 3,5-epimerase [Thermodesulfobacteriota bacterium]
MDLIYHAREIPGLLLLRPKPYRDGRGALFEMYRKELYEQAGICVTFLQDNLSVSRKNVIRGLHFQQRSPQAKLVTCVRGAVYDVALDLRPGSASFGRWSAMTLSEEKGEQTYIPAGFAHGFAALTEPAVLLYKCSASYDPDDQWGVNLADPELAIPWPVAEPLISDRDRSLPLLREIAGMLGTRTGL